MALFPFVADTSNPNAMLALLTIKSVDNAVTLRIVNNNEDVISDGKVFTAYAFNLILGGDSGDRQPTIQLQVDNVDQLLMEELRRLPEPPDVTLQLVWSNQPDVVEKQVDFLRLAQVEYNAMSITGSMAPQTFIHDQFPAEIYDGTRYPDLFFSLS